MAQRKKRVKPAPVIAGGEAIAVAVPAIENGKDGDGVKKMDGPANIGGDVVMTNSTVQTGQEEASLVGERDSTGVQGQKEDDAMIVDSDHADDALVEDAI